MEHNPERLPLVPPPDILARLLRKPRVTDEELDALPKGPGVPELEGLTGEQVREKYKDVPTLRQTIDHLWAELGIRRYQTR